MKKWFEIAGLLLVWGGSLRGVLSLHDYESLNTHSICGPWGCGPPLNALLAVHLGWLSLLLPPVLYISRRWPISAAWNRRIARGLLAFGALGISGIALWQWGVWYPDVSEYRRAFIWQRCGFVLATATDWPLVQSVITGTALQFMQYCCPSADAADALTSVTDHSDVPLRSNELDAQH